MNMRSIKTTSNPKRVLLGMSGGVDSSVASLLLQRQGYTVIGLSIITHDSGIKTLADSEAVCKKLGLQWFFIDARDRFADLVIKNFVDDWLSGLIPNPCVFCNADFKFQIMMEQAKEHECSVLATGHYASVQRVPQSGRFALVQTDEREKDQTYFLYRLKQDVLSKLIFPLAGLQKKTVRQLAGEAGLTGKDGRFLSEKPDSQDICFIPTQYLDLIESEIERRGLVHSKHLLEPGPIVDLQGREIGRHKGLLSYTIGQRRGFEVKTQERLFVISRDIKRNILTVGPYEALLRQQIRVDDVAYSGLEAFPEGSLCQAKIRSSAKPASCRVYPEADGSLTVVFDHGVPAPTPGQSCVFYDERVILAGGVIQPET